MSSALEKSVRNQLAFREVNERIVELTGPWNDSGVGLFKCECSDPACAKSLEITTAEYEQVRADGARFVVLHGHEQPELEHIVDSCTRFLVIEKVGADAAAARAADPRRNA